jgi:hypothetical protein
MPRSSLGAAELDGERNGELGELEHVVKLRRRA